jgi:hypothetical protein
MLFARRLVGRLLPLFLVVSSALAMNDSNNVHEKKIIEPRIDSPVQQFIKNSLWGGVSVGFAGLLGQLMHHVRPTLKQCALVGLVGFGLKYLYDYVTKPEVLLTDEQLLDLVIKNPERALTYIKRHAGQFDIAEEPHQITSEELLARFKAHEKRCPIFMVDECVAGTCPLNRANNPERRNYFESEVVTAFVEKIKVSAQPVQYVGCSRAGNLFQDLVILAKALQQQPDAKIDIHFIGKPYLDYVKACAFGFGERGKQVDDPSCAFLKDQKLLGEILKTTRDLVKERARLKDLDDNQLKTMIRNGAIYGIRRAVQCISFLQKMFPKAQLAFSLHGSIRGYRAYSEKNKLPGADIVVSTSESSHDKHSGLPKVANKRDAALARLGAESMRQKADSRNFWLYFAEPLLKGQQESPHVRLIFPESLKSVEKINKLKELVNKSSNKLDTSYSSYSLKTKQRQANLLIYKIPC